LRDLRDRALIATLTYSFARITAALKMKVEDLRPRGAGWTVRLHEKGGKEHASRAITRSPKRSAPIDAAGIAEDRKGWLFRPARGHKADTLSDLAMNQSDAWCMIRRRAAATGITAPDRVPYVSRNRDHRLPRQRRRTRSMRRKWPPRKPAHD
jgi:hypothetical protein